MQLSRQRQRSLGIGCGLGTVRFFLLLGIGLPGRRSGGDRLLDPRDAARQIGTDGGGAHLQGRPPETVAVGQLATTGTTQVTIPPGTWQATLRATNSAGLTTAVLLGTITQPG